MSTECEKANKSQQENVNTFIKYECSTRDTENSCFGIRDATATWSDAGPLFQKCVAIQYSALLYSYAYTLHKLQSG